MVYKIKTLPEQLKLKVTSICMSILCGHYRVALGPILDKLSGIELYLQLKRRELLFLDNLKDFYFNLDKLKEYDEFRSFAIKYDNYKFKFGITRGFIKTDQVSLDKIVSITQKIILDCYDYYLSIRKDYNELNSLCESLIIPEYGSDYILCISNVDLYNWDVGIGIKSKLLYNEISFEVKDISGQKVLDFYVLGKTITIIPIDILSFMISDIPEKIKQSLLYTRENAPHELEHVLQNTIKGLYLTNLPSNNGWTPAEDNRAMDLRNRSDALSQSESEESSRLEGMHSNNRKEYMPNIESAFEKFKSDLRVGFSKIKKTDYKDFASYFIARHDFKLKLLRDNFNKNDPSFHPFKVLALTNPVKWKQIIKILSSKINADNDY